MSSMALARVTRLPGVDSVAVFDREGQCVIEAPGNNVPVGTMSRVLGLIQNTAGYCDTLGDYGAPQVFTAEFGRGRLFLRWAGGHTFMVLATLEAPAPKIAVSLNAAAVCMTNRPGAS